MFSLPLCARCGVTAEEHVERRWLHSSAFCSRFLFLLWFFFVVGVFSLAGVLAASTRRNCSWASVRARSGKWVALRILEFDEAWKWGRWLRAGSDWELWEHQWEQAVRREHVGSWERDALL